MQSIFCGLGIGVVVLIFMVIRDIWAESVKGNFGLKLFFVTFILGTWLKLPPVFLILTAVMFALIRQFRSLKA
jgi:chromate transport protein ChrA